MNTEALPNHGRRQLHVDFEIYTEGDKDYKVEMIFHMIKNLKELQNAFRQAEQERDAAGFKMSCHKAQTVLKILNDGELNRIIDEIKKEIASGVEAEKILEFNNLCREIITSLESEDI